MEITQQERALLDRVYHALWAKCLQLTQSLRHGDFAVEAGFYNGHYHQTPEGEWQAEDYPIPVIAVKGLCDIEINLDGLSVTAKKRRGDALDYTFERFREYSFEAFGVEGYLDTFYRAGMTLEEMKATIAGCKETEIGFSFAFPWDVDGEALFEFVQLLRREEFYY